MKIQQISDKAPEAIALKAEEEKLKKLQNDRAPIQRELARATEIYLAARRSNQQSRIEREAEQLLHDTGESIDAPEKLAREVQVIEHQLAVFDVAIHKQKLAIAKARTNFSVCLCKANKRNYVEIEKRIATALAELAAANEQEVRFFQELEQAGCTSIYFRPMRVTSVGLASDPQSRAALHRKELQEFVPEAVI